MNAILAREPLIFVDLETTGANFANDRIIEIGFVEVDADGVREWSTLVNPECSVSSFITGLTGIDTQMVEGAPRFGDLAPLVLEKLRGRLFIAHNARFDYSFLKSEFKRLGVNFRSPNLCTVKLSRKLFPQHHRHSLDALLTRFELAVDDRHRALADARVLWQLWQRWHDLLPIEAIHGAVDAIVGRPDLPAQIDSALIDDLPEAPGAYAFYDVAGKPLLVKRGANVRQQVLAHFTRDKHETPLALNTAKIEWRECAGELGARLAERQFAEAAPKKRGELCSWQLVFKSKDDLRPELVFADATDFAATDDLFGIYMNRREALQALAKLAEAHRLCENQLGLGAEKGPCASYRKKICRGLCVGKEALSLHSGRLLAAFAKFRLRRWPYAGPVALIERDEFGTREDFHVMDRWRYLGTVHDEAALGALLDARAPEANFDPDLYRIINKFLDAPKVRVVVLPARRRIDE
jgi:DNA polymerase-3 subunit epsilon